VEIFDILGPHSHPSAPIDVKFCKAKQTQVPVGTAKFDLNRCNESPLRGENPDFWPVSKNNTGRIADNNSPRRGDSLHRFRSNFAALKGTLVRWAVQNFTSIGADGWECGPKNIENFHFLVKSRPAGATPLSDFQNF